MAIGGFLTGGAVEVCGAEVCLVTSAAGTEELTLADGVKVMVDVAQTFSKHRLGRITSVSKHVIGSQRAQNERSKN